MSTHGPDWEYSDEAGHVAHSSSCPGVTKLDCEVMDHIFQLKMDCIQHSIEWGAQSRLRAILMELLIEPPDAKMVLSDRKQLTEQLAERVFDATFMEKVRSDWKRLLVSFLSQQEFEADLQRYVDTYRAKQVEIEQKAEHERQYHEKEQLQAEVERLRREVDILRAGNGPLAPPPGGVLPT